MRTKRWWQFGLCGGIILSLATAAKAVRVIVLGGGGQVHWREAPGFAAAIFAMGFLCGVIVWAGQGLHRRLGVAGDAIVGLTVALCFIVSCMLLLAPEMLGAEFLSGETAMLGFFVVIGLVGGMWLGYDLRKQRAKQEIERRAGDEEGESPHGY